MTRQSLNDGAQRQMTNDSAARRGGWNLLPEDSISGSGLPVVGGVSILR